MKILSLKFKNLNSLKGEWKIDFQMSEFSENGLFVITGQTGAGKSTILDGICLALYQQTPRLDKITQSKNELMTRGTGDCLAEVEFSVNGKGYRVHWAQKRARKNATGKLQSPSCELAEIDGDILATKSSEVLKQVTDITGLDFSRFTKSMLLAQGGFAAFLNANSKERAELLEELTGTEIYCQISQHIFERNKEVQAELTLLMKQAESMKVLSVEQVIELQDQLSALDESKLQSDKDCKTTEKALEWLKTVEQLKAQLATQLSNVEQCTLNQDNFKDKIIAIEWAEKARELEPAFQTLSSSRQQLTNITEKIALNEKAKEQLETQLLTAKSAHGSIVNQQLAQDKHMQQQLHRINEDLAPLDATIKQLSLLGEEKANALTEQQVLSTASQEAFDREVMTQKVNQQNLDVITAELDSQKVTKVLQQSLPVIEQRLSQYTKDLQQLTTLRAESLVVTKQQDEQTQALVAHKVQSASVVSALQIQQASLQSELDNQQNLLKTVPFNNLAEITNGLTDIFDKQTQYQQAIDLVKQLDDITKLIDQDKSKAVELGNGISADEQSLILAQKVGEEYKTEYEFLQRTLKQSEAFTQLKALKAQLQPDHPCPVCGSYDHPNITESEPLNIVEAQQALENKELQLQQARDDYRDLQSKIKLDKKQVDTLQLKIKEQEVLLQERLSKWVLTPYLTNRQYTSNSLQDLLNEQSTMADQRRHIETLQKQLQKVESNLPKFQESVQALTLQVSQNTGIEDRLATEKSNGLKELQRLQKALQQGSVQLKDNQNAIKQQLPELLINDNNELAQLFAQPQEWIAKQKVNIENYQAKQIQQKSLQNQLEKQINDIALQKQQLDYLNAATSTLKKELHDNQTRLGVEQEKRKLEFGEQSQQQMMTALEDEKAKLAQQVEQVKADLQKVESESARLLGQLTEQIKGQQQLQLQCQEQANKFTGKLAESAFADQQQFLDARLSQEKISALQQQQKILNDQLLTEQTRYHSINQNLEVHLSDALTDKNNAFLLAQLAEQKNANDSLNKQLIEIKSQLDFDLRIKSEQEKLIAEQQKQQVLADRWATLNKLIGAADGSKFRTFAQGMTLDNLVYLANQEMSNLHQRYQLQRNVNEPLALQVIDLWQANTVRDVKTLSGGESFLVSLGLALALSNLASQKTQIESLFLDEGFGTLDANTLEVALDALEKLNATGKLIGIISHVDALKERINTQIHVRKGSGAGYSLLDEQYKFIEVS